MSTLPPTSPSATAVGARWLTNFAEEDQVYARELVDSMRIVGRDEFSLGLRKMITDSIPPAQSVDSPAAIIPLSEHANVKGCDGGCSYFGDPDHWRLRGSGLIVKQIIEKVWHDLPHGAASIEPSLDDMRQRRTRTVLVVTDSAISGKQLVSFVRALYRDATFKSWHSLGYVELVVLAYAATSVGKGQVLAEKYVATVRTLETAETVWTAPWSEVTREAIMQLCSAYAHKPNEHMGFGGSGCLMAFGHTYPNNLPSVLTQRHGPHGRTWQRFARVRQAGFDVEFLEELAEHVPQVRLLDFIDARAGRNSTAAERILVKSSLPDDYKKNLIEMLIAARRPKLRSVEAMALALAVRFREVEDLASSAKKMGLLDDSWRLTIVGKRLLATLERRAGRLRQNPEEVEKPYYPQQLR